MSWVVFEATEEELRAWLDDSYVYDPENAAAARRFKDRFPDAARAALSRKEQPWVGVECTDGGGSLLVHRDTPEGNSDFCLSSQPRPCHTRVLVVPIGEES